MTQGSKVAGNDDTELSRLSAELVALTTREHSPLETQIRAAADKMRHISAPRRLWLSKLLGAGSGVSDEVDLAALDRELDEIATRIKQLGEAARGRAVVLRRLSEKAARLETNTHISEMSARFINAAAAKAAMAENVAADAADRFLTQALPLWRTTRVHGSRQMRQGADTVEAALNALGMSIEESRKAAASARSPEPD
ncbi:MAG: hypothetical protein AAFX92_11230 [Pseudomonadota bacterium]